MKKASIAMILAALAASPALADGYASRSATHSRSQVSTGTDAFAQAPRVNQTGSNSTFEFGQYIGQDPDPNVQLELRRGSVLFAQ